MHCRPKNEGASSSPHLSLGDADGQPEGITAQDNAGNQLKWTYPAGDSEMTGEWIQREVTFTSPEDGKVKIRLSNIVKEDMVVNLDDISIKEAR